MVRPTTIEIVRHISEKDLDELMKRDFSELGSFSKERRVHQRLQFVKLRYSGFTAEESGKMSGLSKASAYRIQEIWNEGGPGALCPANNLGRPHRLSYEQREELADLLTANPMETKDVQLFIKEAYGIEYSMKQVHVNLTKMGLNHAKPYPEDLSKPEDAKGRFKKNPRMLWMPPETAL
jgi:putative transposase